MIIVDIPQREEEWEEFKRGVPSSSNFDKILTPSGKQSTQAKNYMYQLAVERITGKKDPSYQGIAMIRGIELEPEARGLFELVKGVEVKEVGICYPDEKKRYCFSPDGILESENKGLEIKCPYAHVHVEYLLKKELPTIYIPQVQGSLMISGFNSWYFMSYYPGIKPLIIEVERDEQYIAKLRVILEEFCDELDKLEEQLRQ